VQIAVSHYSYFGAYKDGRLSLAGFIEEAARIGAQGVELLSPLYRDPVKDKADAKAALAATGLPCPIFSVSNNFAKIEAGERQEQLDKIKFGIDEALDYGATVVRVFAGDVAEGITFDQARAWIVEGLIAASLVAEKAGVKLALENHGTLAGRGDQVVGLVEDVRGGAGNNAFGANPDFGNFVIVDQSPAEAVRQTAPYAYMAHAKDFRPATEGFESIAGKFYEGTVIGEGAVPVFTCLS
jgi:sugar phosphate isomerase/epimerase